MVVEQLKAREDIRIKRMRFEPVTCSTTKNLENLFYPDAQGIACKAYAMVHDNSRSWTPEYVEAPEVVQFKGPF